MPVKDFAIEEGKSSDINTYLMNQMVITCTSGTRPTGVDGRRIWQTDNKAGYVYVAAESRWVLLSNTILAVRKTTAETVVSSTTLQNDDQLLLTVLPNTMYIVDFYIKYFSTSTADFALAWYGPSGCFLTWCTQSPHRAPTSIDNATFSNNSLILSSRADAGGFGSSGLSDVVLCSKGLLITAGTGGTFGLQWCQSTSEATDTTVGPGAPFGAPWISLRTVG